MAEIQISKNQLQIILKLILEKLKTKDYAKAEKITAQLIEKIEKNEKIKIGAG